MVVYVFSVFYLNSLFRCVKEWKSAVQLHLQSGCGVVVGAFGSVSRPEPLKRFTYLDFMDKTKRGPAIIKLSEEIGTCVCVTKCTCVKFCCAKQYTIYVYI